MEKRILFGCLLGMMLLVENALAAGPLQTPPPQKKTHSDKSAFSQQPAEKKNAAVSASIVPDDSYETQFQNMLANGEYAAPSPDRGRITVFPEITTVVSLSAIDQNRIVCPDYIRDARGSTEKGLLEPQIAGKEAFIKFAWVDTPDGPQYASQPNELFILCGDERYQLLILPRKIPMQTVYLSSSLKKRIEQNEGIFKSNSIEDSVIKLIAMAYNDEIPESFSIRPVNRILNKFKELKTRLKRKVIIEGMGLELFEYEALLSEEMKEVLLDEEIAGLLSGRDGLLGSSVTRHKLTRECPECAETRIFVVKSVARDE